MPHLKATGTFYTSPTGHRYSRVKLRAAQAAYYAKPENRARRAERRALYRERNKLALAAKKKLYAMSPSGMRGTKIASLLRSMLDQEDLRLQEESITGKPAPVAWRDAKVERFRSQYVNLPPIGKAPGFVPFVLTDAQREYERDWAVQLSKRHSVHSSK